MSDCVEFIPSDKRKFVPLEKDTVSDNDYQYGIERGLTREQIETNFFTDKNTFGYKGIWLVNSSRDSFKAFENDLFEGIEVYNCCGSFIIAIRRAA
jgi:hypothetical protein